MLGAALAEFAETGYLGTTTAAIAKRSGLSTGLVHHYFGSKADLFVAAVEMGAGYLREVRQRALVKQADVPTQLRRWAYGFTAALEQAYLCFRLVHQVLGAPAIHPREALETLNRFEEEELSALAALLRAAGMPEATAQRQAWLAFYCIGGARLVGTWSADIHRTWLYEQACLTLGQEPSVAGAEFDLPQAPWTPKHT